LIGLSAGNAGGNAEILLTVALEASAADGVQVSLVRLDDLVLPVRPVGPGPASGGDDGYGIS
jgi:hypothetical protein